MEKQKLFTNILIMAKDGDTVSVGTIKEGMLTYSMEDDVATKDNRAWDEPVRKHYELTGAAVLTKLNDPISELLNDMPCNVYMEMERKIGKMPRKMKKAYRIGSRYRRDTKCKRKVDYYASRFKYRLPNAEMVLSREQAGALGAVIRGSI